MKLRILAIVACSLIPAASFAADDNLNVEISCNSAQGLDGFMSLILTTSDPSFLKTIDPAQNQLMDFHADIPFVMNIVGNEREMMATHASGIYSFTEVSPEQGSVNIGVMMRRDEMGGAFLELNGDIGASLECQFTAFNGAGGFVPAAGVDQISSSASTSTSG